MGGTQADVEPLYDSAARPSLAAFLVDGWRHRALVSLLVQRDLASRYRGTVLGLGWTLVTPLAYAGALWVVFSKVARFTTPGVPFVVYVLSGVIVLTFVTGGTLSVASNVLVNTVSLRRTFVPATVFALATALTSLVSLVLSTLVLVFVELANGSTPPWMLALMPLAFVLFATATAGFGLLIGAVSARFADALEVSGLVFTLLGVVTPVFYPLAILPDWARPVAEANPLYGLLAVYRTLVYGADLPGWPVVWAICVALLVSYTGLLAYRRAWATVAL
jgi:ABC-2 type transport system permease protein